MTNGKILIISKNMALAQGIRVELEEAEYTVDITDCIRSGYCLYLADADSIDPPAGVPNMLVFSRNKASAHIKRPFTPRELISKIKEKLGDGSEVYNIYSSGYGEFDVSELTDTEKKLLEVLIENRGSTVSVDELSKRVWGRELVKSNIVNVYVRYLRQKIEKDPEKRVIFTERGKGYRIN